MYQLSLPRTKSSGKDTKSKEKTDDVSQMEVETVDKKNKEIKKETEPKRVISSSGSSSSPQLDEEEPQELDQTEIAEPPVEKTEKVETKS